MDSDEEDLEKSEDAGKVAKADDSTARTLKSEKILDSSDEDELDESLPNYCEELFRFKYETKKKIEEFKDARSKYVFEENFHPSTSNRIHEGESDSEIYNGRCILLRKMRFKTGRLRSHFKTLRPFKNYTLNRQISSSDAPPDEKDEREVVENNIPVFQLNKAKIKGSELGIFASIMSTFGIAGPEADVQKKVESRKKRKCKKRKRKSGQREEEKRDSVHTQIMEVVEGRDDSLSLPSETKSQKRERLMRRKEERKLNSRVLDNLNVDKPGYRYLEPCLCDNGKEVTVVIKGFCLCKKMKQGKHRFKRVCEQYARPHFGVTEPCSSPEPAERKVGDRRRVLVNEDGELMPLTEGYDENVGSRRRMSIVEDESGKKPRALEQEPGKQEEAGAPSVKDEKKEPEMGSLVNVKQERKVSISETKEEPRRATPARAENERNGRQEGAEEKKEGFPSKDNEKAGRVGSSTDEDAKEKKEEFSSGKDKEGKQRASSKEDERLERDREAKKEDEGLGRDRAPSKEDQRLGRDRAPSKEDERLERDRAPKKEDERLERDREAKKEDEGLGRDRAPSKEDQRLGRDRAPSKEDERVGRDGAPKKEDESLGKDRAPKKEDERVGRDRAPKKEDERIGRDRAPKKEDERVGKDQILSTGDRKEKKEPVSTTEDKRKRVAPGKEEKDREGTKEKKKTKEEIEDDRKGVLLKSKVLLGDKRHSGSLKTIFENKPSKKSKMALTKEQLEKMSKITKTR